MSKFEVTVWKRLMGWAEIPVEAESKEHAKELVEKYLAEAEPELGGVYDSSAEVGEGVYEGLASFSWDISDEGVVGIDAEELVEESAEHLTSTVANQ